MLALPFVSLALGALDTTLWDLAPGGAIPNSLLRWLGVRRAREASTGCDTPETWPLDF